MGFSHEEIFPGIFHIQDPLGVCMTLLAGKRKAWLVDAGYGLENVAEYAASLTDRPVELVLTHGHYDHILGAVYFPSARIFEEDMELAKEHGNDFWRKRARDAALQSQKLPVNSDYCTIPLPPLLKMKEGVYDLGSLSVKVIHCPGHTPGSAVLLVRDYDLLLTGDDWNPCTWLFFPEALPVMEYRRNMQKILDLPFRFILCPHRTELFERRMLENFILGLTEEGIRTAKPSENGDWLGIQTAEMEPAPGQYLVFDAEKGKVRENPGG